MRPKTASFLGVDRGAHHGGDLVGGCVKRLMQNAETLFDEMAEFLCGVARDNGETSEERLGAIRVRCKLYSSCLQQFDAFFSCLALSRDDVNDFEEEIERAKKYLAAAMQSWRDLELSVTPKLHLLEDHTIDFMRKYGGLADFDEELVERCHQVGVRSNAQSRYSARHLKQKYLNFSRWEQASVNPLVVKIKKEFQPTTRKRKDGEKSKQQQNKEK